MAWEIDSAHSSIEFSVKHMMVSTVKGRFTRFTGTFDLDEANHNASKANFNIETASIDSSDVNRDNHLRSPDFFDAAAYPATTFTSTQINKKNDTQYDVTGDLTLHGVTKSVVLAVTLEGKFTSLYGKETYAFSGSTSINRKEFGLNWNQALEAGGVLVSEKVNISFELQVNAPANVTA